MPNNVGARTFSQIYMPGFWVTFCHEKVTKEIGAITYGELGLRSNITGCICHDVCKFFCVVRLA
jgi:hypothetical protein